MNVIKFYPAHVWQSLIANLAFMKLLSICISDVEPDYSGPRIEGDVVTLDFVKKMMEDFKNEKRIHKRYVTMLVKRKT